jgi:addiction module HigA family antidote
MNQLLPVHPGEVLLEEFMRPLGISQYRLAKETNVPPRRINEIVQGRRAVTADTALRLARFFGTSEMFWLNLQARYELDIQKQKTGTALSAVRPLTRVRSSATAKARSVRAVAVSAKSGVLRVGYGRKAK